MAETSVGMGGQGKAERDRFENELKRILTASEQDVMSDAILVCRDKTPVTAAARAMADTGWRCVLVVVDPEQPDVVPLGVISSFDVVAEIARPGSVWQEG